jgi:hypothetical protein
MRRLLFSLVPLLILSSAAWAWDDKDKPKPDKPQTPAEQYKAISMEFAEAQKEFQDLIRSAKTPAEQKKAIEKRPNPADYANRLFELAEKNPEDPVAAEALTWIAANALRGKEATKAQDLIFEKYLTSPKIGQAALLLGYVGTKDVEKRLQAVVEKNPHREVQAQASFSLAQHVMQQATRPRPGQQPKSVEEAEKMFQQVIEKYADVKVADSRLGTGTLGEMAKAEIKKAKNAANLAIGKVAPEIEGEDVDGKKFKLTDDRGKVVVIDFWGHW